MIGKYCGLPIVIDGYLLDFGDVVVVEEQDLPLWLISLVDFPHIRHLVRPCDLEIDPT